MDDRPDPPLRDEVHVRRFVELTDDLVSGSIASPRTRPCDRVKLVCRNAFEQPDRCEFLGTHITPLQMSERWAYAFGVTIRTTQGSSNPAMVRMGLRSTTQAAENLCNCPARVSKKGGVQ